MPTCSASSAIAGRPPDLVNPPKGCPFSTRCMYMMPGKCDVDAPPMRELSPGHRILCHLDEDTLNNMEPVFSQKDDAPVAAE